MEGESIETLGAEPKLKPAELLPNAGPGELPKAGPVEELPKVKPPAA